MTSPLWFSLIDVPDTPPADVLRAARPAGGAGSPWYENVAEGPHFLRVDATEAESAGQESALREAGLRPSFERFEAEEIEQTGPSKDAANGAVWTPYVYLVFFSVPEEDLDEFNAWYDQEHTPLLLKAPGWEYCRRFRLGGGRFNAVAVHHLTTLDALDSSERAIARSTEWTGRLRSSRAWFGTSLHVVCQSR